MGKEYFRFREFTIWQDRCAMKVGTDGVLLGAWTNVPDSGNIADLGTGTGLIAIMLAQRCPCFVTGVEIDSSAASQAAENMAACVWSDRLRTVCADVNEFCKVHKSEYSLIVSNPPYFREDVKSHVDSRNVARHTDSLSFCELVAAAFMMLADGGRFSVILPYEAATDFIGEAISAGLNLSRRTAVVTKPGAQPKRVLLEFSKGFSVPQTETSELLLSSGGMKSAEYAEMTSAFYL